MRIEFEKKFELVSIRKFTSKKGSPMVSFELGDREKFEKVSLIGDGEIKNLDEIKTGTEYVFWIALTSVEVDGKTMFSAFVNGLRSSGDMKKPDDSHM